MKKTVMIKAFYLVELDENEILKENGELDKSMALVAENFRTEKSKIKFEAVTSLVLEPSEMNAGRCKKCGCWVSDRDKEDFVEGLNIGANVDGELLCDECLPDDHSLKF